MKPHYLTALLALAIPAGAAAQDATPTPSVTQAPAVASEKEQEPKVYTVGTKVPETVTLVDMDGKKTTMKDLRGKNVVFVWYAKDCPAIKASEARLIETAKEFAKHKDVVMVAMNSDKHDLADFAPSKDAEGNVIKPFAKLRKHMADKKINFGMMIDRGGLLATKFQAKTTPHVFVVDAKGVVQYGALDNDPRGRKKEDYVNYALTTVTELKAGDAVTTKSTRPYG
jgi:alkyl hydroperoxide reductase subunit AhpC